MNKILNPGQQKIGDLLDAIESWKKWVHQYEIRNRTNLADDIKATVITEMCPTTLKDHLYLNAAKLTTYEATMAEITSFAENKNQ